MPDEIVVIKDVLRDFFYQRDKSIVVYYPGFMIENPKFLTSLCLFHDRVILCSFMYDVFKDEWIAKYEGTERHQIVKSFYDSFYEGPLNTLVQEDVLQLFEMRQFYELYPHAGSRFDILEHEIEGLDASSYHLEIPSSTLAHLVATSSDLPLISDLPSIKSPPPFDHFAYPENLASLLATSAIAELSLPDLEATDPENILEARGFLKDELLAYRAGILKLTYLLHQNVKKEEQLDEVRHEADILVKTVINGAVLDLERRIRQHENKKVRRILMGTAKVMFHAAKLFLPGGAEEKVLSGARSIFQMATEIEGEKAPEDQVATYLYGLKKRF